jgi:CRP/FNR family transcriptional regulator, cyclic AMP receptor protein
MEVYKSETRELMKRFLDQGLSFEECMAALDDTFADLVSRLGGEQADSLRALIVENNDMEVYKSETREVIRRFLNHRLSFDECMAALDDAFADLVSRLGGEQIARARALILENNDIVMKEMERRGPPPFDATILAAFGDGITVSDYRSGQVIYAQGDSGDAVFYIQKGRVKLNVVSKFGKQAVLGVLGAGSFLGEGCLKGQPHAATATALGKCSLKRLDKSSMLRVLSENLAFSELFLDHLLSRNLTIEEDMVYQILNSHEKRLARALLMLANFGKTGRPKKVIPRISFDALAQMIGTTISRVSFFMQKFRRLGFIDYNGALKINNSLLNVVLYDQFVTMATDPAPVTLPPHRTPGRREVK